MNKPLNIFYEEPDPDRWLPFDRYPRKLIRRVVRGKTRPGGVMMVALNLMQGLDKLRVPYRFNDYRHIKKHPEETACIIGKPHVLFEHEWKNPIVFGAGVFPHPSLQPDLLERFPNIKKILVPGPWMKEMFEPFYGDIVAGWPTGIDTDKWSPVSPVVEKKCDFLIYDKIFWERDKYVPELLEPVIATLEAGKLSYQILRYGYYNPPDLKNALDQCKAAIFLSASETQGFAYQQMLSANVPVLAWDRGGYWQDPSYYPVIKFGPVSSVPYWDERCGLKFDGINNFETQLGAFVEGIANNKFSPRHYILENLTLEKCAGEYLRIVARVEQS
ncbi:glycosyltransferase [Mucilaginibacter mali]|uniref:Glycosyltransferase n=1 Tax=Mucilaginibacter mali TaxID=2740462 RepID=A0A7D4Q9Y9_9SPHI|nr:glycosyltransferase [Mucilaginibacter mali]QKJ30445.1 glycosyltransferase [Mucilaginibacter mali]